MVGRLAATAALFCLRGLGLRVVAPRLVIPGGIRAKSEVIGPDSQFLVCRQCTRNHVDFGGQGTWRAADALSGDKTKARSAYKDFLTLWNDADRDIPILKQARAEYAKQQPFHRLITP